MTFTDVEAWLFPGTGSTFAESAVIARCTWPPALPAGALAVTWVDVAEQHAHLEQERSGLARDLPRELGVGDGVDVRLGTGHAWYRFCAPSSPSCSSISRRMTMSRETRWIELSTVFSGMSPDGELPEIVERPDHAWFIGVQFHPELKSRPFEPHPLFKGFIAAALEQSRLV